MTTEPPEGGSELLWALPWSKAVLGCVEWPSPCSPPQVANSTDISLLFTAAYLIFLHPKCSGIPEPAFEHLYVQKSRALLRYFAACVSFSSFSPLHWALHRCCHWVSQWGWEHPAGFGVSPCHLHLLPPRHRGRDALISSSQLPFPAMEILWMPRKGCPKDAR